jgi:type II secretory pathway pseudopilin PulG
VVVAIIALLISILLPSLQRARELSKRTVCAANVRGIGQACKIYSNEDPEDLFPLIPYDATKTQFSYTTQVGQSRLILTNTSSQSASTTRCLWLLVRGVTGGSVTVKQFRCPSSDDAVDDTEDLVRYYDFKGYTTVSYGYQVPYGAQNQTRPSENIDIRMGLIADKGPFSGPGAAVQYGTVTDAPANNFQPNGAMYPQNPTEKKQIEKWIPFNSPNHGGRANGEGQNVLFGDSHVSFERRPIVGVDEDNIYAVMDPREPWKINTGKPINGSPIPGVDILDQQGDSSTDTLIYP